MYLNVSGILAGRRGSVVVREREIEDTKDLGSTLSCDLLSF